MPRSDLPFGSEFSQSQVVLRDLLELARSTGGDWNAFEAAIQDRYFQGHQTDDRNRRKLANNTRLAMIAYGIIERDARLTPAGEQLYAIREEERALHASLARHILQHLHGTTLVQCILDMQAGAETVDLEKLRAWLGERGIHFPRGGKHPTTRKLGELPAGRVAGLCDPRAMFCYINHWRLLCRSVPGESGGASSDGVEGAVHLKESSKSAG